MKLKINPKNVVFCCALLHVSSFQLVQLLRTSHNEFFSTAFAVVFTIVVVDLLLVDACRRQTSVLRSVWNAIVFLMPGYCDFKQ